MHLDCTLKFTLDVLIGCCVQIFFNRFNCVEQKELACIVCLAKGSGSTFLSRLNQIGNAFDLVAYLILYSLLPCTCKQKEQPHITLFTIAYTAANLTNVNCSSLMIIIGFTKDYYIAVEIPWIYKLDSYEVLGDNKMYHIKGDRSLTLC